MSYFFNTAVNIEGNTKLRAPQIESYIKIKEFFSDEENKEALVVLPTGTGKSGLISIAPFGVARKRVLIITPGLITKDSIKKHKRFLLIISGLILILYLVAKIYLLLTSI